MSKKIARKKTVRSTDQNTIRVRRTITYDMKYNWHSIDADYDKFAEDADELRRSLEHAGDCEEITVEIVSIDGDAGHSLRRGFQFWHNTRAEMLQAEQTSELAEMETEGRTVRGVMSCGFGACEEVILLVTYTNETFEVGIGESMHAYEMLYRGGDLEHASVVFYEAVNKHAAM